MLHLHVLHLLLLLLLQMWIDKCAQMRNTITTLLDQPHSRRGGHLRRNRPLRRRMRCRVTHLLFGVPRMLMMMLPRKVLVVFGSLSRSLLSLMLILALLLLLLLQVQPVRFILCEKMRRQQPRATSHHIAHKALRPCV